jgi:uncharacterized membrane protein
VPILLSAIAALCWGFGDFAGGVAATKENQACVTVSREVIEGLVGLAIAVIVGGHMTSKDLLLSLGVGLAAAASLPAFYRALADGAMAVVAPVAGVTAAAVPVVVGLATGDQPSVWQLIGIAPALIGIGLVSLESHEEQHEDAPRGLRLAEDVGIAFFCGICFALCVILTHYTSKGSQVWPAVVASSTICIAMAIYGLVTKSNLIPKRSSLKVLVVGALIDVSAYISFIYATRSGLLSITSVVASSYPAITALCAAVVLKEHLSGPRRAGLVVAAAALGLLSIS